MDCVRGRYALNAGSIACRDCRGCLLMRSHCRLCVCCSPRCLPQGRLGLVQLLLPLETQLVPMDPLVMSCCPLESLRQHCKHPSPCRQAVVWEVPAAPLGKISSSQAAEFTIAACAVWQVGFFLGGPSDVAALLCVWSTLCLCLCRAVSLWVHRRPGQAEGW